MQRSALCGALLIRVRRNAVADFRGSRLCVRDTRPSRIIRRIRLAEDMDGIAGLQVMPGECRIGGEREITDRERTDRVKSPDRDTFHSGHVVRVTAPR